MRYLIEVRPASGDRVEGTVQPEGTDGSTPFCGWLELLRLLEPEAVTGTPTVAGQGLGRPATSTSPPRP